jgi:pyruvate formate lyase activating enzyme
MILGGLHKCSLIDYPGKVSCVLFLSGCNFQCPYCQNPELVRGDPSAAPRPEDARVYDFLHDRKGLLDAVVISGGEPTLQPGLDDLCDRIKAMGYAVKLDTNGSRPKVLSRLIHGGLVDYIAMDIKGDPLHYPRVISGDCQPEKILASIGIIMGSGLAYEFRTTCVRPLVSEGVVTRISRQIHGARRYALQRFHPGDVLHPEYFRDTDPVYDAAEMSRLKALAQPWVEECIVR